MSTENTKPDTATKKAAAAVKAPVKKAAAARKRVRKTPVLKRAVRKKGPSKPVKKATALVKSGGPSNAYQQERRAANAAMLRQREEGMTVSALARAHRVTRRSVYQSLYRARQDVRTKRKPAPEIIEKKSPITGASEVAYLRGRVDQLESMFAKLLNVGAEKFLLAVNT